MFSVGTSKLCEASIGSVSGEGIIDIAIDHDTVSMQSQWGFTSAFYLLSISIFFILISLFFEI